MGGHLARSSILRGAILAAVCAIAGSSPAAATTPTRRAHFWRSAHQATAIADRQPVVARLKRRDPQLRAAAFPVSLGLWKVVYSDRGTERTEVLVEDRTGDVLESSPWAYSVISTRLAPFDRNVEIACAALAVVLLLLFFDFRRPLRLANVDLVVLLSLLVSLFWFDRGRTLVSVPLVYPPLGYLLVRLLWTARGGGGSQWAAPKWLSDRGLLVAIVVLVAARYAFNLTLGAVGDVGYASVLGANAIHHGWPLYQPGTGHLDTYGPVTYLAYLPFEFLFPMRASWDHDFLPAAHAAAITFDALTIVGLFLLGRRLRNGVAGRRLGLTLALFWAACPLTFIAFANNTNDGLLAMLLVYSLLAISSPLIRGGVLGLAVAAKFAPLALAPALAGCARGRHWRTVAAFIAALSAVVAAVIWLYLPAGGLQLFWDKTLAFQLHRHSFLSIWGQQPELTWLQNALKIGTVALAVGAFVIPKRRGVARTAALAGAVTIALELTMTQWSYFYLPWFVPLLLVALSTGRRADGRSPAEDRGCVETSELAYLSIPPLTEALTDRTAPHGRAPG